MLFYEIGLPFGEKCDILNGSHMLISLGVFHFEGLFRK